jgi:hypothetical protein
VTTCAGEQSKHQRLRDWRSYIAIVGWMALPLLSVLLMFFAPHLQGNIEGVPVPPTGTAQLSQAELQTADLLAQQRMAQAAEDLLTVTNLGNWLLALTLFASAIAAGAAAVAAMASKDSVRIAKQMPNSNSELMLGPAKRRFCD